MSDAAPHLFAPTYGRATSVFAGAPITGSQLIIRRESGVETPLLAHAAPLREESGAITSAVVAFLDVTAFLDMSRIQAGQLQLDLRRAALWPMVERLLSQQRATTLDHQFQLSPFPPEQRAEIAGR